LLASLPLLSGPTDAFIAASITTITAILNIIIVGHFTAVNLNKVRRWRDGGNACLFVA